MKPEDTTKHTTIDFAELRRRAEAFLEHQARQSEVFCQDVSKLIHELSTYKIELELQNEDLRTTQQELETSRRRYVDLYDFAPVAYLTISCEGLILEANLTAADMFGVERRRLVKRRFSSFIDQADWDKFYRRSKMLSNTGRQSFELRLQRKDDTPFHALVEAVINTEACDFPGQYRLSINDISGRKEKEMARILRLKERYWAIVQDQTELICRFDPQGRMTFVNDAYCRYFGVTYKEILGTNFLPNIYKEDLPLVKDHFRDLSRLKPEKTIEHRVVLADGSIRWQQWCGRALYDGSNRISEYQAVGRDITQLKEAEEKIRKEATLRQLFLDALPCIALLIDHRTYKIIAANKAAVALGALPGELCYLSFMKRDSPCSWCLAAEALESGRAVNDRFWYDNIYWNVFWVPVDEHQYLHYAFDTTEEQRISEALERAHDESEQRVEERTHELEESHAQLLHSEKLAAVGRLSASIAHEFNNPLQSVMTVLKGLEQYASLEGKDQKLVSLALRECLRMKNLIASLRDFHRPTSGTPAPVNLHSILDDLLLICNKDFRTRKIEVEKKYAGHLPAVLVVVDQIKQVFLNLLANAADACEHGGIITITTERSDENIVAHIEDTGSGISQENLGSIFEPFFTTKPEHKGTGLGLSVSYGIVKKHGGRIDVASEPGKGARFSVVLPIKGPEKK